MGELIYLLVEDDCGNEGPAQAPQRFDRAALCQALLVSGCKPRHAAEAAEQAFQALAQRDAAATPPPEPAAGEEEEGEGLPSCSDKGPFQAIDQRSTVSLSQAEFEALMPSCMPPRDATRPLPAPDPLADLRVACSLQQRHLPATVLLCGTSGTGKSTLASLLAARLGITAVVSTDSLRHALRGLSGDAERHPLLWASTYDASASLPSSAAAGAAAVGAGGPDSVCRAGVAAYMAQRELVAPSAARLAAALAARSQPLLLEGAHLGAGLAVDLAARLPGVIPFLVHISNEAKHMERFAVRAKAMTLRPNGEYFGSIFVFLGPTKTKW
jgi:hypothetical protein